MSWQGAEVNTGVPDQDSKKLRNKRSRDVRCFCVEFVEG